MRSLIAIGLLASTLGVARGARATTFEAVTVEELAAMSDLVVVGHVVQVDAHDAGPGGQRGLHTRAVLRVDEPLRGTPQPTLAVWVHGGRLGDRLRVVPGQATFSPGDRVVTFLFRAGGGLWPAGMGRGVWRVGNATDEVARPAVLDRLVGVGASGISLDSLRRRVAGSSHPR